MKKCKKSYIFALAFSLCVTVVTLPVTTYASPFTDILSQIATATTSNSASSDNLISTLINTFLGKFLGNLSTTDTNASSNTLSNNFVSSGLPTASQIDKQNAIISTAKKYMGVPYVWGGTTTDGFDCSGFTQYVMQQNGITIPRTAAEQFAIGTSIDKANLQTGDLVFFTTYKPGASHVGIYMGDGNFINASSSAKEVTITALNKDYYVQHYIGARRYIS